jgi:hypothetical protein
MELHIFIDHREVIYKSSRLLAVSVLVHKEQAHVETEGVQLSVQRFGLKVTAYGS